jgi:hypothetical protein
MSEDIQYKYLKLSTGDNIVCKTDDDCKNLFDRNTISVSDPVVLNAVRVPRGEVLVESYIMYPWFSFSEEKIYEISTKQIILAVNINDNLKENYIGYLKTQEEKEKERDDDPIIIDDEDDEETQSLFDKLLNALGDDIHEDTERHDDFITGRTRRTSRTIH